MKYSILLYLSVLVIVVSCGSEEGKLKELKKIGIGELKYVNNYAHDYSPDSLIINTRDFNFLYRGLSLYNAMDSSVIFVCYQGDRDFLLSINKDSISIYKEELGVNGETVAWGEITAIYFEILKKLEQDAFDSIDSTMVGKYVKRYEDMNGYHEQLIFSGVWESNDRLLFIHYQYEFRKAFIGRFRYENTIKNEFLPLNKYKIVTAELP